MKAEIYTDGGARPTNPGHAGFAVLIQTEQAETLEISRYIGWKSNNEAEYMAVIVGLKVAREFGASSVVITTDSKLVKHQIEGDWTINKDHLRLLCGEARDLLAGFDSWKINHVRGHQGHVENERVDELCTAAILKGMKRVNNPFRKIAGLPSTSEEGYLVEPFK